MSELKAIESATAVIENVYLVYIKSEADKVIAEKDAEIEKLDDCIRDYSEETKTLVIANLDMQRREDHHKYKRCLANGAYWVAVSYQCIDDMHRQQAERHHRKWLELAKQFKEEK